ncbi:MAG TPA: hypothetical protein VFV99_31475 [Kofleriaceae bacterium]|nr:hypothetical protein [Kofleriaceae bacterium]
MATRAAKKATVKRAAKRPAKRVSAKPRRGIAKRRQPIRDAKPPVVEQSQIDGIIANADYALREHIHGDLVANAITLLRGRSHVAGDLALDFDGDDDCPDGTIVDGDLEVSGSIINRDSDAGPFLLVTGNVHAKNLVAGGSEIVILGDLIVDEVIFGYYNHGSITVHGTTRAKAIITEYHSFDLRGRVEGITVSGRGRITADDHFRSYAPALVADVLTDGNPSGGYPDWDLTTEAILSGRPVLRDDVVLN